MMGNDNQTIGHESVSSITVANEFLRLAENDGAKLTHMKLQKLVYFAHGWHLKIEKTPLVNEFAEAWEYGPVFPRLYNTYRSYRANPITSAVIDRQYPAEPTERMRYIIREVWSAYCDWSARELSVATHMEGTPWDTIRKQNPSKSNADIPDDLIKSYFDDLSADVENND